MLILCVGMYRACSTWQYGVVGELLTRHRGGGRLGFVDGGRFGSEILPTLEPAAWSVLKAHDAHQRLAERLDRGQALGLYSHRDLRDVAFSWMHKTGQTFDEMIAEGFLAQCLRNDWFWRDRPGMLLQSYGDLIAEPARGVAEIADHLEIRLGPGEDREIAELLSFEANRKRTKTISERLEAQGIALISKDQDSFDRQTLLHWNHIRDGRAGYWKELATPEQKARLARICNPWLIEHGYEVDPSSSPTEPIRENRPAGSLKRGPVDALLDGFFQGKRGTYFQVGAARPGISDRSSAGYLRGWRGVNVEPDPSVREWLDDNRPDDLNLLDDLSALEGSNPGRTVASLIEEHGLFPPDLFAIGSGSRPAEVLRGVPLADWRPKAFVIEDSARSSTDGPTEDLWEPILLAEGYLSAELGGIGRVYVRGDLANRLDSPGVPRVSTEDPEPVERREFDLRLTRLLETDRLRAEDALTNMNDFKVELARLKARFGEELEDRHRHYLAWLDEREGWRLEREAMAADLQAMEADRAALDGERQALLAERPGLIAERDALLADREAFQADRRALQAHLDEANGRAEGLTREVDSLHGVIGRLLGEIEARDVQIDRTMTQLRPYLKIDRIGVVSAIQRKIHAHRAHRKA